jgi:adenylate cyclase
MLWWQRLRLWQGSEPVDGHQATECEANWQIGDAIFEPFQGHDGSYIRADDRGYQLLINYRNGIRAFDWISISDVLDGRMPPGWARDRVILIGAVGVTSQDFFLTPPSTSLLQSPNPMPGVEVHAQQTSQILSAVLDGRPLMRTWSEPVEMLWIGLWAAIGAIVSWLMRYSGKTVWGYAQNFGSMTIASLTLGGLAYGAILHALWIPLVPPFIALVAAKISITAYIARTAGDIRKTFGRYLTDEVVENLLENPEGLKMGGERREISILTSDLRGFTALSERISPEEVVTILNFYLSQMADVITAYQGTIDEFMGDGILVLFGAPTTRPDDARRAVACAIAMQQAMQRVNAQMQSWDLPPLEMGIGINTGEVVVGNIGSEKRTKYGVVGSQVNLTYRIESYTTGGQILISPTTLAAAGDDIRIDAQKEVMPKGVRQPIAIYEVGGIGGEYQLYLDHAEETFYPLTQPLEVAYTLLDGKHLGASTRPARLTKLSARGAELYLGLTNEHLAPLCNLKLNLAPSEANSFHLQEDIYAKVKEMGDRACLITFTAQPPAIAKYFQKLYREVAAAAVQ